MSNPTWQTERLGLLRPDQDLRPRLRRTSPPSVGDMANWAKIDAFYQEAAPDAGFTDVETLSVCTASARRAPTTTSLYDVERRERPFGYVRGPHLRQIASRHNAIV